jgi:hypothetical protein
VRGRRFLLVISPRSAFNLRLCEFSGLHVAPSSAPPSADRAARATSGLPLIPTTGTYRCAQAEASSPVIFCFCRMHLSPRAQAEASSPVSSKLFQAHGLIPAEFCLPGRSCLAPRLP